MAKAKNFYALKNITYLYRKYKKGQNLNERIIIDIFKGIKDSLDIAQTLHFYKLYYLILNRLNIKTFILAAKKYLKNKGLRHLISNIIHNINLDLLKKGKYKFKLNGFYNQIK